MTGDTLMVEKLLAAKRWLETTPRRDTWVSSRLFDKGSMLALTIEGENFMLGHPEDWARAFAAAPRHVQEPGDLASMSRGSVVELDPLDPNADHPIYNGARRRFLEAILPTLLTMPEMKARLLNLWRGDLTPPAGSSGSAS